MPILDFMFCVKAYIFLYILPQCALLLTYTLLWNLEMLADDVSFVA